MTRPFRLALPSKGRMHEPALALARDAGVEVGGSGRALSSHCARWDIEVLLARSEDIPGWAQDGAVELAIAGRDQIRESGAGVQELAALGFGRCRLAVAVGEQAPVRALSDLAGCRVATSHPRLTRAFLDRHRIDAQVTAIRGSVELAPRLDAADAVVDLVSSGDTLHANGLRPIATVLESEAVLLGRAGLRGGHRHTARELATVMRSVVAARDRRYLMLNAPDAALDGIVRLLPGMDSPTVLPLAAPGMHAVHAVVPAARVIDLLGPLRAAGARSLLVLPIDNLIP